MRDVAFGHHDDDVRVQRERPYGWRPGDADEKKRDCNLPEGVISHST